MALPHRQARFVEEYLVDLNATRAAIRAGYSARSAAVTAAKLLKQKRVAAAVADGCRRRAERLEVKQDEVLLELLRIARSDIGELVDEEGQLLPLRDMHPDSRRAIASIEVEEFFGGDGEDGAKSGCLKKVKLWNKGEALQLLGKHLKLFTDKVELSGRMTLEQLVEAASKAGTPK